MAEKNIGSIFLKTSSFDEASRYLFSALNYFEEIKDQEKIAGCLIDISSLHKNISENDKALKEIIREIPS